MKKLGGSIMKKLVTVILTILLTSTMFASRPVAVSASSVLETVNGGGTALMGPPGSAKGVSSFGFHATLYADGSAVGHFDCVDQMGDVTGAGNIFGDITSWSRNGDGTVSLYVTNGKFVKFPGGLVASGIDFTVTIQKYGGAGVGHWSLTTGKGIICWETLISGQIVEKDIYKNS
jgi:hypothetical protein